MLWFDSAVHILVYIAYLGKATWLLPGAKFKLMKIISKFGMKTQTIQ